MALSPSAAIPAPAIWKYAICNRDGSNAVEVPNTYEKKVVHAFKRPQVASGQVRLDHPLADRIQGGDVLLKAYRNSASAPDSYTLRFIGPVLTCEENADDQGQTVDFTAAGGFWYVQRRLLGKNLDGSGWAYGTAGAPKGRADIAGQIMKSVNADGFTGIKVGTIDAMPLEAHIGPVYFSSAGDAIMQMAAGYHSFDWEVVPVEPQTTASDGFAAPVPIGGATPKQIGLFNAKAPTGAYFQGIGIVRDDIVFEYGSASPQVTSYKRSVSRENLLTYAYTLPPGFPTSVVTTASDLQVTTSAADAATLAARGREEEQISTDLVGNDVRQALGDAFVAVRKGPRYLVTFSLAKNAMPRPYDDYDVGDIVRARAYVNGVIRFDAMFRVWGITTTADNAGNESVELELIDPGT